ncbi:lamin tail domain-containing protein [Sediminibacillus halophilus]|uniref:3',5'-cyclic AMP phosphodiesterase CpdA n=1 Tax=Sediminibacillus halophilus TaxID=482461 RepID=A0A1G9RYX0_9BACI|nr:lamin tail domain-containing protein [Sediminibacillus halophilus]SDM28431.1 3',5'-cyclic AMP phosphodiesterase CpdA [Sediminibacillus halophilus]
MKRRIVQKRIRQLLSLSIIFTVLLMDAAAILPGSLMVSAATDEALQSKQEKPMEESAIPQEDTIEEQTEMEGENRTGETDASSTESKEQAEESQKKVTENETETAQTDEGNPTGGEANPPKTERKNTSDQQEDTAQQQETKEQLEDEKPLEPQAENIDIDALPPLMITEINSSEDGYSYFELHNHSNLPFVLDFLNFSFSSSEDHISIEAGPKTIEPDQSLIFWNNEKQRNPQDFIDHYQADIPLEAIVAFTGPMVTDGQKLSVTMPDKKEIVSASYTTEDGQLGKAVHFQYPESGKEMRLFQTDSGNTPTLTEDGQLPEQKITLDDTSQPVIHHDVITEVESGKTVKVEAEIEAGGQDVMATLFYQTSDQSDYDTIEMTPTEKNSFSAELTADQLQGKTFTYYMTVTTAHNQVTYPAEAPVEVKITQPEKEEEIQAATIVGQQAESEDFSSYPHLLITELSPNSEGTGTDYFEYFELYNNTDQPLSLTNYRFLYNYLDSDSEVAFQIPETILEPQETRVFWYNNGGKTIDAFNANYDTELTEEQIVEVTDSRFPGFSNGGNRALILQDNLGEQVIYADYLGEENDNTGADIHYQYPTEGTVMKKYRTMAEPTPGAIDLEQVPAQPVPVPETDEDVTDPVINHKPVLEATAFSSLTVEATITDDRAVPTATLYVKAEGEEEYTALAMSAAGADPTTYTAEIPSVYVRDDFRYYIEASDGIHTVHTKETFVKVEIQETNPEKLPSLLVTEVVPDSTNTGSADGYEFIEVYNNTNQAINFQDYKLQYRYGTDPESDVLWPSVPDDVVIPSGETLVFWVINGENGSQSVADFNANYGTDLVENQNIVRIHTAGMANGSMRGLIVATNAGEELSIAYYNDEEGVDDTKPNKGIVYTYPRDGSNLMKKVSAGMIQATPGSVEDYQIPGSRVTVPGDETSPIIDNLTEVTEVNQTEDIDLAADVTDDIAVKTVQVHYRTNGQEAYQSALLQEDYDDMLYHFRIYSPEIIAKEYVEYYFTASDGTNQTTSDTHRIQVTSTLDNSSLRLNVQDGDVLNGEKVIKATSREDDPEALRLLIDDKEAGEETTRAVEHPAYFAFEVSGVNTYFQNGVTIGDEIVHIFDDWIAQWQTITVPIDPEKLKVGANTITIRAGNKATPWEGDPGENRDDYNLRNVRLVLSDGTVLIDPAHADAGTVMDMGDDGTMRISEDFTFTIEEELAPSKAYLWETEQVQDGRHIITAEDQDERLDTEVYVDNTAPVIETNIEESYEYKGEFAIDVSISDEIAGVEEQTVWLDGEVIDVPYAASSGTLTAGTHELRMEAIDNVGNQSEKMVEFSVVDEHPSKPVNQTPQADLNQPINGDPTLRVKVNDPMGDSMDVGFYQAYQYTPADLDHVVSFSNKADVEPPATPAPDGEAVFKTGDISLASEKDGKYMVTDSTGQFPYHRFDVTVDDQVDEDDRIELVWNGNSLPGRKVTMYAWNHPEAKWEMVDYRIAGEEDFELTGTVSVRDFVKDSKVNVIVQDEIPSGPEAYDYTFVWMSDTQYYSESYPYIYDKQTKWIVENREAMNIQYVMHTGDLVDESDKEYQWLHADDYMKTLDEAGVPYGVLAGNHDVAQKTNDYTEYYKYFGADRFQDKPYYGGSYLNNRGHYDLISANGNDYIMVYLGWGVEEEGIAWMNEVLAAYPDRQAILNFHEYLQATGTRHPLGEKLYNEVVVPNENVIAVLSGHYHEAQLLVDELDDDGDGATDRTVYQMLADYQAGPEGGQGYMRLLHFDTANNRIFVNTYSPYLDDYNYYDSDAYPDKDEFTLELDLEAKQKRVATDSFAVNVYTNNEIGTVEDVPSGETAEVTWTGLEEGETYSWYALITDQFTGETRSDIWSFVKGNEGKEQDQPEPPQDEEDPAGDPVPPSKDENPVPPSDNEGDKDDNDKPEDPVDPGKDEETPPKNQSGDKEDGRKEGQEKDKDEDGGKEEVPGNDLPTLLGGKLADTATNMYNLLVIGFLLFITGTSLFIYFYRKKRLI